VSRKRLAKNIYDPKKPSPPVMPPASAVAGSRSLALLAAIMLAAYDLADYTIEEE
jgi:hypothetical protein